MTVYKSKTPTKDGRQYFFRIKYKDIRGITHDYSSQKYKTQKEAVNEEAQYRIKIGERKFNNTNITIKQAYEEYLNIHSTQIKKQSVSRIKDKYKHLEKYSAVVINKLDINNISKIRNDLLENIALSYNRKNEVLELLKRIIKFSNKYYNTNIESLKYIEYFKDKNIKSKEMDFFTYDEYKLFDSVIDNFTWHTFFEILYFMGLRQGECQALTWSDIDFKNKKISINKTLTSKIKGEKWTISSPKTTNSTRILPLPKKLVDDLKTLYNEASKLKDFSNSWFIFGNTLPFKENNIANHKNRYCKNANLKQIRIHDFRHSCASLLINQGASITLVSKYLGHSKVSITLDIYSHFYKSELENIVERINNL